MLIAVRKVYHDWRGRREFSMLEGVNQLLEEESTAPEFPTFLIKAYDESNDSVIGQCLIITQNIGPDTTAANCWSVNFCQR